MRKKLERMFYDRPTLKVAQELLGKYLVVEKDGHYLSGKIVEAEAYIGEDDPASHSFRGKTKRNQMMWGEPGHTYIYLTYGMYHCLNLVTEKKDFPAAVLIRAIEPKDGIQIMKKRRRIDEVKKLANGPAKLCICLGLDRNLNGVDLCSDVIWVEDRGEKIGNLVATSRVGINEGKNKSWRFYVADSEFVSRS